MNLLAPPEFFQVLHQHVRIEGVRVVIIEPGPLRQRHIMVRLVIVVMIDDGDVPAEALHGELHRLVRQIDRRGEGLGGREFPREMLAGQTQAAGHAGHAKIRANK